MNIIIAVQTKWFMYSPVPSPLDSQILSRSSGEKSGEGLGSKLRHGLEMVDSVSTLTRTRFVLTKSTIFLHDCEIKSGSGLGTRLVYVVKFPGTNQVVCTTPKRPSENTASLFSPFFTSPSLPSVPSSSHFSYPSSHSSPSRSFLYFSTPFPLPFLLLPFLLSLLSLIFPFSSSSQISPLFFTSPSLAPPFPSLPLFPFSSLPFLPSFLSPPPPSSSLSLPSPPNLSSSLLPLSTFPFFLFPLP